MLQMTQQNFESLNCRDGTETSIAGLSEGKGMQELQFDVCQDDPALDNLIDDPKTPFDETSVGRYMPGYVKLHCNDDGTVTVRHYHDDVCNPRAQADYGASLQRLMNGECGRPSSAGRLRKIVCRCTGIMESAGGSLAELQEAGAVMQFQAPDKISGGVCYPLVSMDLSSVDARAQPVQLATKYCQTALQTSRNAQPADRKPWLRSGTTFAVARSLSTGRTRRRATSTW